MTLTAGQNKLGVLYPGYRLGAPITVKEGEKRYITVYNGIQHGAMYYTVEFSGALNLVLASSTAMLAAIATNL